MSSKASDMVADTNLSLLFKAPWGHGKTLAAASFALDGPVYLAYWDKKKPIELKNYFATKGEKGRRILNNIQYDVYGAHNANEFLNKLIDYSKNCSLFAFICDSVTNLTSGAANWSLNFNATRKCKDKIKILPDFDEYKVVTSLATQGLDICRTLPCHVIWTAHPVSSIKIEGSGQTMKVTKVNPIVAYGNKAGDIIPGNFSEIYHFAKQNEWDANTGSGRMRYIVDTDAVGDDFAKSNIGLKGSMDITDGFFYEIWKQKVAEHNKEMNDAIAAQEASNVINPFATQAQAEENSTSESVKVWNPSKGVYE